MSELSIGSIVTAFYKTGKYIGEITDIRPQSYLVRVLAVLKHPMQGDLHQPKEAMVEIFHERKALSYREQMNAPKKMVKLYTEESVPSYPDSLQTALKKLQQELKGDDSAFATQSLKNLEILNAEYYKLT
ncbi:kinase-associated lipoprotein B [Niallia sp. FSL W8-0635]|uniref:kinase-associated lipoprotein B n=1 Tax=Niallia sp. FSL W8-0635 TaxID=2975337 RepID=UPI002B04B20D|nr:kinase-associated lipoprotein B [Yersinia enterocolitica]